MVVASGVSLKTLHDPNGSRVMLMRLAGLPGVFFVTVPNVEHLLVRSD